VALAHIFICKLPLLKSRRIIVRLAPESQANDQAWVFNRWLFDRRRPKYGPSTALRCGVARGLQQGPCGGRLTSGCGQNSSSSSRLFRITTILLCAEDVLESTLRRVCPQFQLQAMDSGSTACGWSCTRRRGKQPAPGPRCRHRHLSWPPDSPLRSCGEWSDSSARACPISMLRRSRSLTSSSIHEPQQIADGGPGAAYCLGRRLMREARTPDQAQQRPRLFQGVQTSRWMFR